MERNVLLIGSGGREHALFWKLSQSPQLKKIYCTPGNGGTENNVDLDINSHQTVIDWCREHKIDLVVIGPEQPLVDGLADDLRAADIKVFGCSKAAARLEGSKAFMKDLAAKAGVPTANYVRCTLLGAAYKHITEFDAPVVIKADGLAAGKGVVVATTIEEAQEAAKTLIQNNGELVIEDFMEGPEISFFALCDGKTVMPFTTAQDHKRAFDGDQGPNTGGMGAFSPARASDMGPDFIQNVMDTIIEPTLKNLEAPYIGVLYAGLMNVDGTPKLIEYNVRFGDPECQIMLPRLKNDLLEVFWKTANQQLDQVKLEWSNDAALNVVMATKGYPGSYKKGSVIKGLETIDSLVFHAGTKKENGQYKAVGGRVLNVVGTGKNLEEARQEAYTALKKIDWPEGFYRSDIGLCR